MILEASKCKLADDPDQLLAGLSEFLQEVGSSSCFIDPQILVDRGMKTNLWLFLQRGLMNDLSFENRIFQENLKPKILETEIY